MNTDLPSYTAFAGERRIVSGDLNTMLTETKARIDRGEAQPILIFEDQSGRQIDFNFSGTLREVLARAQPRPARGRPKLGVVSREVTLLPRHWEWLEHQPGGISAALRKLVEEARRKDPGEETRRRAREAGSGFMFAMAGNLPGYEEASRALFGKDRLRFERLLGDWPKDIRRHLLDLTREAF